MAPTPILPFPGTVLKIGSTDSASVRVVQARLEQLGCGPTGADGQFDAATRDAVRLFQARFTDADDLPLRVDGEIGPITWAALFGGGPPPAATAPPNAFLDEVIRVAQSQIGKVEQPLGSNRGPEVDLYLQAAGLNPLAGSFPWCAAFLYWCCEKAAANLGRRNPATKTAAVLDLWNRADRPGARRISAAEVAVNPGLVKPGQFFLLKTSETAGHTGLIEAVAGGKLTTIEGNTNDGGGREGIGVFRRTKRKIGEMTLGFVEYS
jgi:peptidoglycan hydrolase-like protein with peptidoglycan-binding domain